MCGTLYTGSRPERCKRRATVGRFYLMRGIWEKRRVCGKISETGNKNCCYWQDSDGFIHQTCDLTMPKMSIDTYTEYLELAEVVDAKQRYSKQDIEAMGLFICKAYGDQFTVEELKNPETGLDAAGLILEFQFIDMGIADELTKRMENIEKNFQSGK